MGAEGMSQIFSTRPAGAIRSLEHLNSILEEAKVEPLRLFYITAIGKSSSLTEYVIDRDTHIKNERLFTTDSSPFLRGVKYAGGRNSIYFSLNDCNVPYLNGYNDHMLFEHRLTAGAYLKACRESEEMEKAHQKHLRWCDRMFGRDF
jgi:hypothetical protein